MSEPTVEPTRPEAGDENREITDEEWAAYLDEQERKQFDA